MLSKKSFTKTVSAFRLFEVYSIPIKLVDPDSNFFVLVQQISCQKQLSLLSGVNFLCERHLIAPASVHKTQY